MKNFISTLIATTILTACAGGTGRTVKMHGNFCGPNYPNLQSTTRESAALELQSIKPVDDLDQLCQAHDLCYVSRGVGHHICDGKLRAELMAFHGNSKQCNRKASNLAAAMTLASPMVLENKVDDGITAEEVISGVMQVPATLAEKAPWAIAYAFVLPINAVGAVTDIGKKAPPNCDRISKGRGYYGEH